MERIAHAENVLKHLLAAVIDKRTKALAPAGADSGYSGKIFSRFRLFGYTGIFRGVKASFD